MNLIFILLTHLFFASTFTVTKIALWYGSPLLLVAFRLLMGGMLLLSAYTVFQNHWSYLKEKLFWRDVLVLSFCMAYIPYCGEYWAMDYLSSIKTVLLYNLSPFVTALLCYSLSGERLSSKQIMGMMIGFFGALPLLLESTPATDGLVQLIPSINMMSLPELTMFIVMITAAYGWIFIQQSQLKRGYPILLLNSIAMIGGGSLALIHAFISGPPYLLNDTTQVFSLFVLSATALTVLSTIGHTLYSYILSGFSATFVSLSALMIPLITAFLSSILLGESVTIQFVVSMVLISLGLVLFYIDEIAYPNIIES